MSELKNFKVIDPVYSLCGCILPGKYIGDGWVKLLKDGESYFFKDHHVCQVIENGGAYIHRWKISSQKGRDKSPHPYFYDSDLGVPYTEENGGSPQ